jgi:hypothetical protein
MDLADRSDLRSVDVTKRKIIKEVIKGKNTSLFFQQISSQRAYPF